MSVRRNESGDIILEGTCAVEDAEALSQLLQATPKARCDWTRCSRIHTAVIQVMLVASSAMVGPSGDAWIEEWVSPHMGLRSTS